MSSQPISRYPTRKRRKAILTQVVDLDEDDDGTDSSSSQWKSRSLGAVQSVSDSFIEEISPTSDPAEQSHLADRFVPKAPADLALHSSKNKELTKAIESCKSGRQLILLTGPPGCGKTTAVRVICNSQKIVLKEWEDEDCFDMDGTLYENEKAQFLRFISNHVSSLSSCSATVKLVRFLPSAAYCQVHEFREQLLNALYSCRQAVIFCLTDVKSCYSVSPCRIFTAQFIKDAGITTISMNQLASTFLSKALRRVSDLLPRNVKIPDAIIPKLAARCNGDLRLAFNMLQFSSDSGGKIRSLDEGLEACLNDDMFHMLGRILYAHRKSDDMLPRPSWLATRLQRPLPEHDPNVILSMSTVDSADTMLYLHDHMLAFSPSLTATRSILDDLSFADSMTTRWDARQKLVDSMRNAENWKSDEYVAQIAARSVYFNNWETAKSTKKIQKFHGFTRPKWKNLERETTAVREELATMPYVAGMGTTVAVMQIAMLSHLRIDDTEVPGYLARSITFPWTVGKSGWTSLQRQRARNSQLEAGINRSIFSTNSRAGAASDEEKHLPAVIEECVSDDEAESIQSEDSFDEDPFI